MSEFRVGVERLQEKPWRSRLSEKRVGLLTHPAALSRGLDHSVDLVRALLDERLVCCFGPQHGMRGEKQDNMVESDHYMDDRYGIPVYSLYGESRRPRQEWIDGLDAILVDLQDVGVRVYTYLTTLAYVLEEMDRRGSGEVWVLDRPNPNGRRVEGLTLEQGEESFVGVAPIPMRHGLTLGEFALWYRAYRGLSVEVVVVPMAGWTPHAAPWPAERAWIEPSPNLPTLETVRAYPGTVMIEGTRLSEGRGTTKPLMIVGHPEIEAEAVLQRMGELAPRWLEGAAFRSRYFEPVFHKHAGELCSAIEILATPPYFNSTRFAPFRVVSLLLKATQLLYPKLSLWSKPPYEYEEDRLPFDVIHGGPRLRKWIESETDGVESLEAALDQDESQWERARKSFLLYPAQLD